jgi:hypothetical protein
MKHIPPKKPNDIRNSPTLQSLIKILKAREKKDLNLFLNTMKIKIYSRESSSPSNKAFIL